MKPSKERPYVLFVAEKIYHSICDIKKKNSSFSNIDAVENFIGSKVYNEISSGEFHDQWFEKLKKNSFIDKETGKKIPEETIKLLRIQKYFVYLTEKNNHRNLKLSPL